MSLSVTHFCLSCRFSEQVQEADRSAAGGHAEPIRLRAWLAWDPLHSLRGTAASDEEWQPQPRRLPPQRRQDRSGDCTHQKHPWIHNHAGLVRWSRLGWRDTGFANEVITVDSVTENYGWLFYGLVEISNVILCTTFVLYWIHARNC